MSELSRGQRAISRALALMENGRARSWSHALAIAADTLPIAADTLPPEPVEAEQTDLTIRWMYLAERAQTGDMQAAEEMTRLLPLLSRATQV
jgi:hypothetical protein